jgi:hypothetical protein
VSDDSDPDRFFLEYRECCRHVWNAYFQTMDEGWHEFIDVDYALFQGLVLSRMGIPGLGPRAGDGVVEAIQVVPEIPPIGHLSVFSMDPSHLSTVQWAVGVLKPGKVDLRYAGFFDWRNHNDPMDMQFVRVRAFDSHQPELIGKDLLIEFQHVRFTRRADGLDPRP